MKLSIDDLLEKSEQIASDVLLNTISGGIQDECHKGDCGDLDGDDLPETW